MDETCAVILAAGEGTRLRPHTLNTPKCLLEVGGRPLLEQALTALEEHGIQDVILVVGHCASQVGSYLKDRSGRVAPLLVQNPRYATTNNAYSLWLAASEVRAGFVLLDGDLFFEPKLVRKLLDAPGEAVLAVERRAALGTEEMKVRTGADGGIVAVSKDEPPATSIGESIGAARFSARVARLLFDELRRLAETGATNVFYELAFQRLIDRGIRFDVADVTGLRCMEIDTAEDLAAVRRCVGGTP